VTTKTRNGKTMLNPRDPTNATDRIESSGRRVAWGWFKSGLGRGVGGSEHVLLNSDAH
jgi:hypothetical protein